MGLRRDLAGIIPDSFISLLSDRYEITGTIAIVLIPQ